MFATGLSGFDFFPHRRLALNFDQELHAGVWYPRWLPDVNHGYGNPTFIFYNPLYYYVVSLCRLLVPGLEGAMYLAAFLGLLLSGLTMYQFARQYLSPRAATWAGLAYILLPYHAMNLYSRAALAEFWAMAWLPLILTQATRLQRGHQAAIIGLAFSYAALIYTHLCTAFLFSLFLVAYILYLAWAAGNKWLRPLLAQGGGMVLGLGLGTAFLLPAVLEQPFVQIQLAHDLPWGNPLDNFLFAWPTYAAGFSLEVSIGAVLTLLVLWASYRVVCRVPRQDEAERMAYFFIGAGLATLILMTCLSWPLWKYLPILPSVQFPWRLLTITTLCAAFALGAAADHWSADQVSVTAVEWRRIRQLALFLLLVPSLLWLGFVWWRFEPTSPPPRLLTIADVHKGLSSEELAQLAPIIFQDRAWDILEFRPVWAPLALPVIAPPAAWAQGHGFLQVSGWESLQRDVEIDSRRGGTIKLRTFYYPGWTGYLDGKPWPLAPDSRDGAIRLAIPPGKHHLVVAFERTPTRALSEKISQSALVFLLALGLLLWGCRLLSRKDRPLADCSDGHDPRVVISSAGTG